MTEAIASAFVDIVVNGRAIRRPAPAAHVTLLDWLRDEGFTAAKEGCAEGECGACAVAMVVPHKDGSSYRAVNSCLMFASAAAGGEFYTAEGLSNGPILSEAQNALAAGGGSQCGYCTPGFVISLFAEHYRPDRTGPCDPLAMAGNLCRCTGYRPIRDAALALGAPPPGTLRDRLAHPAPRVEPLQIEGFSRPGTVAECVAILAADPAARILAGGTDMAVESNLHARRFTHLVSVEAIDELHAFVDGPRSITIGAALPLTDVGALWTTAPPVLREWLTLFASPLIRHRATLGGNLGTASPIGDGAPLLMALDAIVHVAGVAGRRTIRLADFFTAYRRTALQPGEIITAIELPRPLPDIVRFYKVAKRKVDDISSVAMAVAVHHAPGRPRSARLAFGGVAAVPLRLEAAEQILADGISAEAIRRVQDTIDRTLTPLSDHRASREYRLEVAKSLLDKFVWESAA